MRLFCLGVSAWALAGAWTAQAQYNPELGDVEGNQLGDVAEESEDSAASDTEAPVEDMEPSSSGAGIDYSGSVRLGLETVLLSFVSTSADGGGVTTDESTLRLGIVPSELGVNVGYAFLDQFVAGARLQASMLSSTRDDEDLSAFGLSFQPYCEYVFTPGQDIEWLAYGLLGIRTSSSSTFGLDTSRFDFSFGAGGGAHIVLSDMVSIDPVAEIGYAIGSLSEPLADYDLSTLFVSVRAGISLWL